MVLKKSKSTQIYRFAQKSTKFMYIYSYKYKYIFFSYILILHILKLRQNQLSHSFIQNTILYHGQWTPSSLAWNKLLYYFGGRPDLRPCKPYSIGSGLRLDGRALCRQFQVVLHHRHSLKSIYNNKRGKFLSVVCIYFFEYLFE